MTRKIVRSKFLAVALTLAALSVAVQAANSPRHSESTETKSQQAWDTLQDLSQSGNIEHRKYAAAAYALLATRNARALQLVSQMLAGDKDLDIRTFVASALALEHCRAAIPALRKSLNDPSTAVAFAAAKALWDMNDHSGAGIFQEVLLGERRDNTNMLSGYLEDARHKLHEPKKLAILGMNEAVSSFLGPAGMVLSLAEENMKDKGAPVRAFAAGALSVDRSAAARKSLESSLQDSSGLVRASACRSLALLGYRSALPFIEPLLDDKNEATRSMASAAYLRLTHAAS